MLPQHPDEVTIGQASKRLLDLGYCFGKNHLRHHLLKATKAEMPARQVFRPRAGRNVMVMPWDRVLAWAQDLPRLALAPTILISSDDITRLRYYLRVVHEIAAGAAGMLVIAVHTEEGRGWETDTLSLVPVQPGAVDETIAVFSQAIQDGDEALLLPMLWRDGEPVEAVGVLVCVDDPDLLLRLPQPPRYLIEHEATWEAVYLFQQPYPIARVRNYGWLLHKLSGGIAIPAPH